MLPIHKQPLLSKEDQQKKSIVLDLDKFKNREEEVNPDKFAGRRQNPKVLLGNIP